MNKQKICLSVFCESQELFIKNVPEGAERLEDLKDSRDWTKSSKYRAGPYE